MLRASHRLHMLPTHLDTCLTRCLIGSMLIRQMGTVDIHIGFRAGPGDCSSHEGHAWLSLNGSVIYNGGDDMDGDGYIEVRSLSIS